MTISTRQLLGALEELELASRPVIVHASLRSFGEPVDGGADALLDVLVSRGCTVLVPSFTEPQFGLHPPPAMRPSRNGIGYSALPEGPGTDLEGGAEPVYTVDCGLINAAMGVLPAALIARSDAHRGRHPLNSFAAIGPKAAELVAAQSPADVYGPIRALAGCDGTVLLIGVGLNRMTALHLAEQQSGRRLFLRWARRADGRVGMVEVGSCSEGFPRLEPHLRPHARTAEVGAAPWTAYPAQRALAAAVAAIKAEPSITHCRNTGCERCNDAIAGGPIGPAPLG